jgi:hypothetical protein
MSRNIDSININNVNYNEGDLLTINSTGLNTTIDFGQYNNTTALGYINSDSSLYVNSLFYNSFKLNDEIEFRRDKANLVIVKNCNLAITYDESINDYIIFKIEKFEENFLDYNENCDLKDNSKKEETNNVFGFINEQIKNLCDIDENFYIDLKNKKVYQYLENENSWIRKSFGNFKLKLIRNSKLGEIKKLKQEKFLILEKQMKLPNELYIPNYKSFNFNFQNSFTNFNAAINSYNTNNIVIGNNTSIRTTGYNNIAIGHNTYTSANINNINYA